MSSENIHLILYRLYAHEITVEEAYKIIMQEMSIEYKQDNQDKEFLDIKNEFQFIEQLWEDFGHVPKTINYLIEALNKRKYVKQIGKPFKDRFTNILQKIFIDCELGKNTLSKMGSTIPNYDIKEYGPTNYEYWNNLLEVGLELSDNQWFISFAHEYEIKKKFFLCLQKHT